MLTAILICVLTFGVLGVIFMIRLLMDGVDTRVEIRSLRSHINDIRNELLQEHDYTQNAIAEVEHQLDIIVTPIEDQLADSVKKMFYEISKED